ncbi:hypothetical protein EMIHUDRAFT_252596 [Emiliania huxleyi CCMP1516]|uniref:Uncharacterized protein n=2 Tax=Emiliania huxleyi TaxID=2903 RepID=A0A0D3KIM1_EMIH1|nr:hypothetical protein EMIHUDRAFT_252596 [Emiliania huxleyi CCMP1516]EOD35606.1 hypothetical protein EMIHUDRAFT_252596 [Emiliania huxleyi CCMP1516]|eukprot:XP_005788035.1 hypothetical protein EMIHUDRAFT_252596 [Emiliania huxleyi CCMP1516]
MDATRTQELAAEEEAERQRKRAREKEAWRAQRERSAKKTAALQGHDEAWGRARVAHVGRAHSVAGALDAHIERHWRPSGGAGGRVVGGDRRIPSYGGDYRYAREDKGVEVQLLLFESFGGFGKGVREILRKAADVLQNKLTRAQYLDEVTWTTKSWLGLQKQRISVVLHTAIAEQIVNELACGGGGRVHGAKCLATLAGVA